MAVTLEEAADLLAIAAGLDPHHSVTSKEKMAAKAYAWSEVLDDCEFRFCKEALLNHYRDPNAKTISPAMLRMYAKKAVPVAPRERSTVAEAEAHERKCNAKNCPCPHDKCFNGWSDEETTITTRHGQYPAVKRCPTCKEAKEMESL